MITVLIILGYGLLIMLELPPLIKRKKKKELALYSVMMGCAFLISILLSVGVEIPSPAKPIEKIVMSILGR
ncbi:hypothetical protein [Dethiothermospora halolimnae]|uniref:hypothetical protein n=1 Tax=Dethiothermospora halolimnae TaxID=3114390 RepID=UPI003CCBF55B